MAALKEPVKIFIVQALACRDTPQEVADQVYEEFGIKIDRKQCQLYDPTKAAGKNLSQKFIDLFNQTRDEFDRGIFDIPIANKFYRMKEIQKMYNKSGKNIQLKQSLIKLAREETRLDSKDSSSEKAQIELEIKKLELEEMKRRVNPPKEKPPEEDYRLPIEPDEDIPNEPIL